MDGQILKAVQNVGIDVDKSELLRALKYDRNQYEKGYEDGKAISQWIPVSERLPEDGFECEYLLTWRERTTYEDDWEYNVDCCTYLAHDVISPFAMCDRWQFSWDFDEGQIYEPIAWMPLPEPYKKGDNNER